jgi:hypothetical protein
LLEFSRKDTCCKGVKLSDAASLRYRVGDSEDSILILSVKFAKLLAPVEVDLELNTQLSYYEKYGFKHMDQKEFNLDTLDPTEREVASRAAGQLLQILRKLPPEIHSVENVSLRTASQIVPAIEAAAVKIYFPPD